MEEIKYTIGLMVDSRREYGANRVTVGVYRREENTSHPLNISADTYGPQRGRILVCREAPGLAGPERLFGYAVDIPLGSRWP